MNHQGKIVDSKEGFNVIQCENCNFKHLDPIPSAFELDEFYKKKYYQVTKPEYLEEDRNEIEHRNIFFDQRLDFFLKNTKGKSLLDIGCGDGIFMQRAIEKGFDAHGIEPSEKAVMIAELNNQKIFKGTLKSFIVNNKIKFDIVHLRNVLEHLNDPIEVIKTCYDLLNPNGIIYLEVPNDYNFFQEFGTRINNEIKSWICVPDHINYFNFNSLETLLKKNKFKIIRRDTTFPMYIFLLLGLNFIRNKKLGKYLHKLRVNFELICKKIYLNRLRHFGYIFLANLGLGRTVILYGKK